MTEHSGAALEPAIGDVPIVVDETPPGVRPPLWPPVPRPVLIARMVIGVVLAAAALYAPFYFQPTMNRVLSQAIYLAIAAMGLNLLTGFNGQVSIGHGAFFGVGAFTSAILMVDHGWTYEPTILVAALLSAAVGVLVGVPALRVRGLYLALVTLGPRRPVPAHRPEVRRRHRRRGAAAAAAQRLRVADRRPRRRPVGLLPVPGHHGRAVPPGLEPRAAAASAGR